MTREEANNYLQSSGFSNEQIETIAKAYEHPSYNSVKTELDAISRQAVLDVIAKNCIWENEYNLTSIRIKNAVEQLPSVSTEKTGRWILKRKFPTKLKLHDEYLNQYGCSECYRTIRCTESQLINYPYCHCGAKMEVEE